MSRRTVRLAMLMMRRPRMRHLLIPSLLFTFGLSASPDALAGWPPPKNATRADVKNPENWPNDPGYGYQASATPSERRDGQWNLYGFIPDRSPNAPPIRPDEFASGMSVDLAWRNTIGDPRVRVAVLDSGVKWDEADLIEKAYLNIGELANHKPHFANGDPCGGEGELAGFDCNGDGVLSVADYAEEPSLSPEADGDYPKGDRNRNRILDAGDLILHFSDGIDDDGNGYVDDISGWDFMKDDNDPYDDTRYGHGTGEAKDSCGAANNGISDAGICALCRFIPLRVGDSFIVNVQDYAQAVVYATDNGASVVQEALGTINQSSYSQAAMDYAYSRGVTIVASMADENARHHNMPAVANHTLPVHAIVKAGSDNSTTARSFYGYHTCSNFGGHNLLSAPGDGCSSEATGVLSGVMGLVYSAALQSNLTPPLSAGEAHQLALMTADDIDVPESRGEESQYYWSQPGFDQRFGYGRVNADRAVQWAMDGKIPPAVDVVSPTWFTVLYPDRVSGPIDIQGTISAKRANSFDYVVEWAPGVQPLDEAFQPVPNASQKNVPPSSVIGGNMPIAQLEIRDKDIDNPPDPDDTFYRENRFTITVRVKAVAHYGGEIGDVPAEMRRTYYIHKDPDLLPGFPMYVAAVPEGTASGESSPKLADMDGDGTRDIISATADGLIHVLKITASGPQQLPGFPFRADRIDGLNPALSAAEPAVPNNTAAPAYATGAVNPDLGRETFVSAPAVADVDGDGKNDIVAITWDGTIYGVRNDGSALPGFPVRMPRVPSCPLDGSTPPALCMDTTTRIARGAFGSPVLVDMNNDGKLDVVAAGFDGYVHVYKHDGSVMPNWPVLVHYEPTTLVNNEEYNRVFTTPTVDDFNGDGTPDVLVGSNERLGKGGGAGGIYLINGRGNDANGKARYLPNWPVTITSLSVFPVISEGTTNSGAAGDFDGDGRPEAVMHGTASAPVILPLDPGTQDTLGGMPTRALPDRGVDEFGNQQRGLEPTAIFGERTSARTPDTFFPLFAQPALGDLNQDGHLDLTASGGSLSLAQDLVAAASSGEKGQNLLAMWDGQTGKMFPGSPVVLEDYTFFNNQVIADLDGDDYPEVITGTGSYFIRAANACGREAQGFPKFTGQWIVSTVAVGDIDGDGMLELVVNSRNGWLYAWKTKGSADGVIQWESYHHDNRNTGSSSTPLEQGVYLKAAKPLDCSAPVDSEDPAAAIAGPEPGGGCSCRTAQSTAPVGSAAAALLTGLGLALARRSRRRD